MSGVKVPHDRTVAQPVVARCRNPECREDSSKDFEFIVEHDRFACPKCGADRSPMVFVTVLTHLLIPHPQGPIRGSGGRRFVIGCDDKRAYLATVTNKEAATADPSVANCPGCLANAEAIKAAGGEPKERKFIVPDEVPSSSMQPQPETNSPTPEELDK